MADSDDQGSERQRFWHRRRPWVAAAAMLGVWVTPFRIVVGDLWGRIHHDAQVAMVACVWLALLVLGLRWIFGWLLRPLALIRRRHSERVNGGGDESSVGPPFVDEGSLGAN